MPQPFISGATGPVRLAFWAPSYARPKTNWLPHPRYLSVTPPLRKRTDYDLVVVGYGLAGASAAIAAAENGASVLVLDRGHGGGASAISGGVVYSGGGTPYQKACGHDETPQNMFNYLRKEIKGVVDDKTLKTFCDGSVARLAWLEKHGAKFDSSLCDYKTCYPTDKHYLYYSGNETAYPYYVEAKPVPRGHRQIGTGLTSGEVLWSRLRDSAKALGITFQPASRVEKLVVNEDGSIGGVHYRVLDKKHSTFKRHRKATTWACKFDIGMRALSNRLNGYADSLFQQSAESRTVHTNAVVLSAGGFVNNRKMVQDLLPKYVHVMPLGTVGDDGTGIRLGQSVGGSTAYMNRMTAWRFLSPPSAFLEGVSVGLNGKRIMNEDLYGATHAESLVHDFDGKGYLILDASSWKEAKEQVKEQTQPYQKGICAYLFSIGHWKADTLNSLASKIGVSPSGLEETIDAYNLGIEDGTGDPAKKNPSLCVPIKQTPFYAINISLDATPFNPVTGLTLGGLRVCGESGLVLKESGDKIKGLYAAGRNAVGVCSNSYVSGLSLADCVFSGKRAGEHAAAAIKS
jgi:3-oxo-5alpha-steroid 4-dehydrogenase